MVQDYFHSADSELPVVLQEGYRGRDAGYPAPPAQIRACTLMHTAPPLG